MNASEIREIMQKSLDSILDSEDYDHYYNIHIVPKILEAAKKGESNVVFSYNNDKFPSNKLSHFLNKTKKFKTNVMHVSIDKYNILIS